MYRFKVHSYAVALFFMARGHWPVACVGQDFVFEGDEDSLNQDKRRYHANKKALDALMYTRVVEKAT